MQPGCFRAQDGVVSLPDDSPPAPITPVLRRNTVPVDLLLVVAWLAAAVATVALDRADIVALRVLLNLPLMLFIPGYCAIAAFFPRQGDISYIERFALSFGLSIAVVPLIGLGLNFTPFGIRLIPVVISVTLFTLVMVLIAYFARTALPQDEQYRVHFFRTATVIREGVVPARRGRSDRILGIVLALAILGTAALAVYVITVPLPGEAFTEFYILGKNQTAEDYPKRIIVGTNYPMFVGVGNYEHRNTRYTIETWMLFTEFDNVTNSTRIRTMDPGNRLTVTLAHNQTTIIPYNFSVGRTGYNRVEFLLFDEDIPGFEVSGSNRINESYCNLHLLFSYGEVWDQEPAISEQVSTTS